MRILVTGGAGFLGSHLCERLVGQGHQVRCVDDFSTGRIENVEHFLAPTTHFSVHNWDMTEPFVRLNNIDQIYNLACPASPSAYQNRPIKTMRTCVLGAINVLDLACLTGARVLQASTSEVYGDPLQHPQSETYWGNVNPIGIRSCYDEGKRAAETLFMDYHRQYGVDIRIARIFNTYGPRMQIDDGRVVSNFIVQALRGHPLTIYGSGEQTRSLCYVDDMIDGLILMMNEENCPVPMNLGMPVETSMSSLASIIIGLTGSKSGIQAYPLPDDDPQCRRPDVSLAASVLGWPPQDQFLDDMVRTIAYFREELARQAACAS